MSNRNIYTVDQFNTKNRHEEEIVQYVLDNVPDFGPRYSLAKRFIGMHRWPLSNADYGLFCKISDAIYDWCADHEDITGEKVNPNTIDIEQIFGAGERNTPSCSADNNDNIEFVHNAEGGKALEEQHETTKQ